MDLTEKEFIVKEVYKYLKNKGYKNIKSTYFGLEKPNKFVEKQSEIVFEPDLIATYNSGSYLFEVETIENIKKRREKFVAKCNLFLQYAHLHKGKLILVVPEQQFEQVISEINKCNLENVGILQVSYS